MWCHCWQRGLPTALRIWQYASALRLPLLHPITLDTSSPIIPADADPAVFITRMDLRENLRPSWLRPQFPAEVLMMVAKSWALYVGYGLASVVCLVVSEGGACRVAGWHLLPSKVCRYVPPCTPRASTDESLS